MPRLCRWPPKPNRLVSPRSSHGESGVDKRTRRRLHPVRGRRGGAGGEAAAHPGRPARRGGRRGGRRMAQLGREPLAGPGPRRRPAAGPITDGSARPPGRAPPRPNRALVRLRQAPPRHPSLSGADPTIAATAAGSLPRLTMALKSCIVFFFRRMWWGSRRGGAMCCEPDRWRPNSWQLISVRSCSQWREGETFSRLVHNDNTKMGGRTLFFFLSRIMAVLI